MTLVELMVGLTLSLLIVAVIGTLYVNSKQVFRTEDAVSRLQETGRFASHMLEDDIRMAGFRGCEGASINPVNTLNLANTFLYQFNVGITGFSGIGGNWNPSLDPSISGLLHPPLLNTDVITVRRAASIGAGLTPPLMNTSSADIHVDANNDLAQGDIMLVSDCAASAVFQTTNANPASGSIVHNVGNTVIPGNATKDLQHVFGTDATLYRIVSKTYYIASSALTPGTNSLWVYSIPAYDGAPQPEEVAQGVDSMKILYGVDTDGDKAANKYVSADQVSNWDQVVSVKLQLLLSSLADRVGIAPQSYTFNGVTLPPDRRIHSTISTVITLRNRTP